MFVISYLMHVFSSFYPFVVGWLVFSSSLVFLSVVKGTSSFDINKYSLIFCFLFLFFRFFLAIAIWFQIHVFFLYIYLLFGFWMARWPNPQTLFSLYRLYFFLLFSTRKCVEICVNTQLPSFYPNIWSFMNFQ